MARELNYDRMMEDALRGVVRTALAVVAKDGLPGAHHFYLTFRTGHAGVQMADHLRRSYTPEMTIVLQHQFWGLKVGEESFSITVSFNGAQERLTIPFAALTAFVDPAVKFGIQFQGAVAPVAGEVPSGEGIDIAPATGPAAASSESRPDEAATAADAAGQVVTLDQFRKKK